MFGKTGLLKVVSLAALAVIALVATGCSSGSGVAAVAGSAPLNSITVTGYGEANGAPDLALVQMGIDVSAADVGVVVGQANDRMESIMKAVRDAGVEDKDMQTSGFNVWPEDRYNPETGQPTGERIYHVQNTLQIKVRDLTRLGAVIDAALKAGANQVYGLSFTIDDSAALENEARVDAVADARARAEELAAALGLHIGKAMVVSEGGGSGPIYYGAKGGGDAAAAGPIPPISGGTLTVSTSVTITFELVP